MSDQDKISPYNIYQYNIKATTDENKDQYQLGGILVDPIPDSPNWHHKSCMPDSKENMRS